MGRSSEPFRNAVLGALERLKADGAEITKAKVIGAARFEDGRPVGQATLYRKKRDGEYVHRELILLIDEAAVRSSGGPPSAGVDADGRLSQENQSLRREISSLIDQIVAQELENGELRSAARREPFALKGLETDNYVLACLLAHLVPSFSLAQLVKGRFEKKYRGREELEAATREMRRQLEVMSLSQLAPTFEIASRVKSDK